MRALMMLFLLLAPVLAQPDLVLERSYPAAADSSYQYVPFRVPSGTREIQVRYSYQDRWKFSPGWLSDSPKSAVDIGLFDGRGHGFRGWSGGKRTEFRVGQESATPGYLAGPFPKGELALILGLYRIAPGGVTVRLEIDFLQEETGTAEATVPLPLGRERGPSWYKGDLHLHTVHSDGDRSMHDLATELQRSELDFVALTEHNTSSHHNALPPTDRLVLLGEEVTTLQGHYNAWGLPAGKWLDFREPFAKVLREAHTAGALISINHPYALCKGCGWSHGFDHEFDTLEVWNGPWDPTDEAALKLWDRLLREGRRITAVASSDSHKPEQTLGHPCTAIEANSLSQVALFEGLREGRAVLLAQPELTPVRVTIHTQPDQVVVEVEGAEDNSLVLVHGSGQQVHGPGSGPRYVLNDDPSRLKYVRLEFRDRDNRVVQLTNPVYLDASR